MKIIKKILCLFFAAAIILYTASALADDFYINESFNEYATYSKPAELDVSSKAYWIHDINDSDKCLLMTGKNSHSMLSFSFSADNKFCISFDIKCIDKNPTGSFILNTNSGNATLLKFERMNLIKAFNGKYAGGFGKSGFTNMTLAVDLKNGSYDIYTNGKLTASKLMYSALLNKTASGINFSFNCDDKEAVLLDNVNVFAGNTPRASYPADEYLEEEEEEINLEKLTFEPYIGNDVKVNEDFETGDSMTSSAGGNTLARVEEEDGNHALLFERKNTSDFHSNINDLATESDYFIVDYDIKNLDKDSVFQLYLTDQNNKNCAVSGLTKGGVLHMGENAKTPKLGEWHKVSIGFDLFDRKIRYWYDGTELKSGDLPADFANGAEIIRLRFHATVYSPWSSPAANTDSIKFMVDNIRVYDSDVPLDEVIVPEKKIELTKKSVFNKNTALKKSLADYMSLHLRSGVIYANGEKNIMLDVPHKENDVYVVNTEELSEKLGISNPYTEKYVAADKYFREGLKKQIYTDNKCLNSGMIIAGSTRYQAPSDMDSLQKLNDFLYYLLPEAETVEKLYKSSDNYGVHPRLQVTRAGFDKIKQETETNVYKKAWAQSVISSADGLMKTDVLKYELRDGSRLLYVSRDMLKNMYALAMAYQLTGDMKYVDRAWLDLDAVCNFVNWHPSHSLDVGEMAAAVAIGYDWMYHALTPEQRAVIEKGIYQNALYDANILYTTAKGNMSTLSIGDSNWNNVISGGLSMAAMAVMDVYPEIAYRVLGDTVKSISSLMWRFAPDGAWYEGAGYWEYVMQYTVKMITSLETNFGTAMGLDTAEGLQNAAEWEMYMQSPFGIYSYGDAIEGTRTYCPEMLWLAGHYGKKNVEGAVLKNCSFANGEDLALALLWYDISVSPEDINMPVDKYMVNDAVVTMRNSWSSKEQNFVGIHAGETITDHFHLDGGSFVFDSMGIRWARDLGMGGYNKQGYWDESIGGKRWTVFRLRAEAHNTLVINPADRPNEDHRVDSNAPIVRYESKPKGGIAVVNMNELFGGDTISARRGFFFTDNRNSLVIRDELNLRKASEVYWFMITGANVSIDGNTAILEQDNRRLKLEFSSSVPAEISVAPAAPLPTSPKHPEDEKESASRIAIKLSAPAGEANITVKLTPYDFDGSSIEVYNTNIDSWTIPDGEIPQLPTLSEVLIDGKNIAVTGNSIDYFYLKDSITSVPDITANDDRYNIEIKKGASLSDSTRIILTDKNDPTLKSIYSIIFRAIPRPHEFEGMESLPVITVIASAEPQEMNRAINVLDDDLSTRWSADGMGQYLIIDLNTVQTVDNLAIAFASGNVRKTRFSIALSEDGSTYNDVFSGMSSGETLEHEFYPLGGKSARYVKLTFNGNTSSSSGLWNSVTEVVVTRNLQK